METKVATFIYCLGTTKLDGENGPLNAMGVLPVLTPEFIPSTFSFSIILGLRGIDDDYNHTMDIIFKDAEGKALVEANDIPIPADKLKKGGDSTLPKEYKGLMLGMDMRNVILKQEGLYSTEIIFDGKRLGEFDIYAKAKQQ